MSFERLVAIGLVVVSALFIHGFWNAVIQRHCMGILISASFLGLGIVVSAMLVLRGQRSTLNLAFLLVVVVMYVMAMLLMPLYVQNVLLPSGLGLC